MRITCLFILLSFAVRSQIDSAIGIPLIGIHVGGQVPSADLSNRYGPNLDFGGLVMYKTKKNWVFGIESNYLFGRNVKEDVLAPLKTADGFVVDNAGYPADIRITERGAGIHLFFGKVFRVLNANPNSGLLFYVGAGGMQHKIKLYDAQQSVASIKGPLAYGYDRLSAGYSFSQFLGYLFISENRFVNFYIGLEAYEAFTKSVRKLNYDTGQPDTAQRFDQLTGLRFGWILPLYRKKPNEFYYN